MDRHKPDYSLFSLGSWYRLAEWFSHRAALPALALLLTTLLPCHAETKVTAWGLNDYGQTNVPASLKDAVSVVAGWSHSAALRKDGTVVAWGGNWEGQSTVPQGLKDVVGLSSGGHHTLALRKDGTVVAWGYNAYGQLNVPADLTNAVAIAGGAHHSLALRRDGAVVAWGWNLYGQADVPPGLKNVVALSAGHSHSLALRGDGTVVAWGDNSQGQCTVPADLTNAVMVSAGGQHSLALRADGRVVVWGANGSGQLNLPSDLTNVVALAAGYSHSLALRADGIVVAWGDNTMGQTNTPATLSGVGGIASCYAQSLALSGDIAPVLHFAAVPLASLAEVGTAYLHASATGTLPLNYQWSRNGLPIPGATNAVLVLQGLLPGQEGGYSVSVSNGFGSVSSGEAGVAVVPLRIVQEPASVIVSVGGAVRFSVGAEGAGPLSYQWRRQGVALAGQTNETLWLTNVPLAAAGGYSVTVANQYGAMESASALLSVVRVFTWGQNDAGQVPPGPEATNLAVVAAGYAHTLGRRRDGTVVAWGDNTYGQRDVPVSLTNVVEIAAGGWHNLALRANGTVTVWGANNLGQYSAPADLTNAVAVAAGGWHNLALRADGTVAAWGDNSTGQTTVPPGLDNVVAVAAGMNHSLALMGDGRVAAWGSNANGQTGVPGDATNAVLIAAGAAHSLALRADGTVLAWGANDVGQSAVPANLAEVVALAAGGRHSLALRRNGIVEVWGDPVVAQTNLPAGMSSVMAIAAGFGHCAALDGEGPPLITFPALHRSIVADTGRAYLRCSAVGTLPLHYQWNRDGVPIAGATNAVLTLTGLLPGEESGYSVTVNNTSGVATSGETSLVVQPLRFSGAPTVASVLVGGEVQYLAHAEGAGPLSYLWRHDGADLLGETNDTLTLRSIPFAAAGRYRVKVTNHYGSLEGPASSLRVVPALAWGQNEAGQSTVPMDLTNLTAIAGGASHTLALRADGSVSVWGNNTYGQLDVPAALTNVVMIAAGGWHNAALRSEGRVTVWGANNLGQGSVPATLTNAVAVAAGGWHNLALRADGTVVAWGSNDEGQGTVPPNLNNVVAIGAGMAHSLALRGDGEVIAWGRNSEGQTQLPGGLRGVVMIAAGGWHSLALKADGTMVGWGANNAGQINLPSDLTGVVAMAAGGRHSMALRADGTVAIWGDSAWGVNTLPSGLLAAAGIAAGDGHALAMGSEAPPTVWLPAVRRTLVAESGHAFLHASAIGARPLSYQWRRDGVPIAGATNPVLEVQGLLPGQEGSYSVRVGNAFGSTDSSAARPIAVPLRIVEPPGPFKALVRGTARFSIRVEGAEPLSYQWLREGVVLPAQTNQILTLSNLAFSAAGNYSVRVANRYGSVQSDDAALRVQTIAGFGQPGTLLGNIPTDLAGVVAVAAGYRHAAILRRDGSVVAWGDNYVGQLNVPAGLVNVVSIAAGDEYTLALRENGTIAGWGDNFYGQLNIPLDLTNAVAVAAGKVHSIALRRDGMVACWGADQGLQPTGPGGLSNVVAISAGQAHSVALRADGTVVAWGDNSRGQTNVPTGLVDVVKIDAGDWHTVALRADGSVVAWGSDSAGQLRVPTDLIDVRDVAAGGDHSLALQADGTVVAWGNSGYGETAIPSELGGISMVAAGPRHSLVLAGMGTPFVSLSPVRRTVLAEVGRCYLAATAVGMLPLRYQWNRNGVPIPSATNAILTLMQMQPGQEAGYSVTVSNALGAVTSGASVVTVEPLRLDVLPRPAVVVVGGSVTLSVGTVGAGPFTYQWRRNGQDLAGQTNATLILVDLMLSESGDYSVRVANHYGMIETEAVRVQAQLLFAWGFNGCGQTNVPMGLFDVCAFTAGGFHVVALRNSGTVVAWGLSEYGQALVPTNLTDVIGVAAGVSHTVALRSDGTVTAWGGNWEHQSTVPPGLTDATAIASGSHHTLALRSDGSITGWGYNASGQLNIPAGLGDVLAVAAGASHSLALRSDGTVVAWGDNSLGQAAVPPGLDGVVAVAAGGWHNLALKGDGTVVGWGANNFGQATVPANVTDVVAVAGGYYHSLALRSDGTVLGWGSNASGEATSLAGLGPFTAIAAGHTYSLALHGESQPVVCIPLSERTLAAGLDQTILRVRVAGRIPTRYQWSHDGKVLAEATNAVLVLREVDVNDAGSYRVTVRDSLGADHMAEATVRVVPVRLVAKPQSVNATAGQSATFSVGVEGVGPFTYQWRKDGLDLPGATNDALQLTNLYFPDAGQYSVRVSNRYGTMESPAAALQMPDVVAWGANASSQLDVPGDLTNVVAIMGGQGLGWALREDGTLARWGDTWQSQSAVPSGLSNVVAFALGGSHVLALRQDHTVVSWGANSRGQASVPSNLGEVVAVASGYQHSLALRADGTVAAWGDNYYRQTDVPLGLANVVAIAAGDYHSLALRTDGVVMAWGRNSLGQGSVPTEVVDAVAIAAGGAHNLALLADGSVMAWGDNANGQTRVPWDVGRVVGIAAKSAHSLALRVDGTVVAWGDNSYGQTAVPIGWNGLVDIAAGVNFNLALHGKGAPFVQGILKDRTIVAGTGVAYLRATAIGEPPLYYQWQREGVDLPGETRPVLTVAGLMPGDAARYSVRVGNRLGQAASRACWVRVAPMRFRSVPQPATLVRGGGATLSVAVEGLGPFTYQWRRDGVDLPGQTKDTLTLSNAQEDAMGHYSVVVANSLGTLESPAVWVGFREVYAWGFNQNGEVNVPAGLGDVLQIGGGDFHSLAVKRDGTVVAWGMAERGRTAVPADLTEVVAVAGGRSGYNLALQTDGTVAAWGPWGGYASPSPVSVPSGLSNVVAVAGGFYGAAALCADGSVATWDRNHDGPPITLPGFANIVAIMPGEAGERFGSDTFIGLRVDGTVHLWESLKQRGSSLVDFTNIVAISSYGGAVVGLREDGTVASWGGYYGIRIPPPAGLRDVIAIAAGASHSQALRRDGTVVGWGSNLSGQTNTPAGLSNVVAVAAGWDHTLAQVGYGPPVIRPARPQELVISDPAPVYLYSQAVGAPPLLCQWQADGVDVPGATNWWLRVDQLEELHTTRYQVVVRNAWGTATNLIASLTRQTSPPFLSNIVFEGGRFRCTVTRTSAKLPCVIWQSADLEAWTPAYTNAPTAAGFEFVTPPVQGSPARFYRATITP